MIALLCANFCVAQSLGDVARQSRRDKSGKPSVHVYDNENLTQSGRINVVGEVARRAEETLSSETSKDGGAPRQLSPAELAKDWEKRITEQKKLVSRLEEELLPIEKEYRRLESECAWKHCRIFAGIVPMSASGTSGGTSYSETPEDRQYFAAKQRYETAANRLAEARAKLDAMQEKANRETGQR